MRNVHPVDELAEIRARMKALVERESELKSTISTLMGLDDALFGADHVAFQKMSSRKGAIDADALAKAGVDVDAFRKPDVAVISITVERCATTSAAA